MNNNTAQEIKYRGCRIAVFEDAAGSMFYHTVTRIHGRGAEALAVASITRDAAIKAGQMHIDEFLQNHAVVHASRIQPGEFPEANVTFTAAEGDEDRVSSLQVYQGVAIEEYPVIVSKWQPSAQDLERLNNGGGIYLTIVSESLAPVSLTTENPVR